jgi:hypothetical protein
VRITSSFQPSGLAGILAFGFSISPAAAATFVQTVNSTGSTTAWNNAIWGSPAAVPAGSHAYVTASGLMSADSSIFLGTPAVTGRLRAYAGSNGNPVFAGDSVTIVSGTELLMKEAGTFHAAVILDGGILRFSPNESANATMTGGLSVIADSVLGAVQSAACTFTIASTITGTGTLRLATGTATNQTITFDGEVNALNGFAGTLDIGGGSTRAIVDFNQAYDMALADLAMGKHATADILNLDANITVASFSFGANSPLAAGTYTTAGLNGLYGNGSQFTGSGTLTVTEDDDTDDDGLPDSWEQQIIGFDPLDDVDGLDDVAGPLNFPSTTDFDGDGLSDAEEYANRTHPTKPDTDNDGLKDGAEVAGTDNEGNLHGFGPTKPSASDSDMDGYGDAFEIAAGTDPNSPTSMPSANPANPRSLPSLSAVSGPGGFSILTGGNAVPVVYDAADATVVGRAVLLLADDVEAVGGVRPVVSNSTGGIAGPAVLVGTLGQSSLIDGLVTSGKLDVSGIRGNWESYRLARVIDPLPGVTEALVVVGSDRRGTAYGLGAISEAMGVSPWTWWADVPAPSRPEIHLSGLPLDSAPPSVRFRGIFINDEDWGLQEWAEKTYEAGPGEMKDIGPKTYAKVFELLLRLRSNYCWPGMHPSTKAFHFYPENKQVADDYAIVMGSSHAEPMARNNVDEWSRFVSDNGYSNNWNYSQNKDVIYEYWDIRAQETAPFENTYVVGKRGIHDSGMVEGSNNTEKAAWLNTIFADQREILTNRVNPDPSLVPQIFVPYKEVLSIYDTGLVNVPDDVTMIWPDDNHGYIRRLSNSAEQQRGGGGGVYYHLSYWGAPQDYLWLSSIPPSLIWEEMMKAYENQCHRLWVFNVGDIKPAEITMEYSLRLAWNVHSYGPDSQSVWLKEWAAREFGGKAAGAVASVMNDYFRLNHARKPEHMNWKDADQGATSPPGGTSYPLFSQVHEGDELAARVEEFELLRKRTDALYDAIPAEKRDAFYQLVTYPVRGSHEMNLKFLETARAQRAVSQKRKTASLHSAAATSAYNRIISETNYYNTGMSAGKWNRMMDWKPRGLAVFNMPSQPADPGPQSLGLGVAVEGRLAPVFTGVPGGNPSSIELHAVDNANPLVAPMQETTLDGLRCTWTPGSGGAAAAGAGGRAVYSFTIPATGSYAFKFLVRTPNANDDSWHIQLNPATPVVWNDLGTGNLAGWRWVVWNTVSLTAGAHSLTVHEREDGAAMAALSISSSSATGVMGEDNRFNDFRLPEFNKITRRDFFIDLINTEPAPLAWTATTDDPWVVLSSTSGSLDLDQRLTASINWSLLPPGQNLASAIHVHQGTSTIDIPVTVWNPASPITSDFIEENGAVVMEAEHPSTSHSGTDAAWVEVENLGLGDGAMIVQPTTAPSLTTPAAIIAHAPSLEYSFHLRTAGSHRVDAIFLPALSLNDERGRRYAVSVNGETPTLVSLSSESGSGNVWSRSVLRQAITGSSTHSFATAGDHTLRIWMVDPGLVLDRVEIHTSLTPYTYSGLRETAANSPDTMYVAAGETFVLDGTSRTYKRIVIEGTLEIRSSAIEVEGNIINFGTLRVKGASTLTVDGNVSNFGVMDSLSWQPDGVSGFPDYTDFGSLLDSSHFRIENYWLGDGEFHIQVPGYQGHRYVLHKNETLSVTGWVAAGSVQDGGGVYGNPEPVTFNSPIDGSRMFFRVGLDGND